jgi:hypothetical protein
MPNKHGGARPGAGRPPKLTDLERLQIGATADQRLRQETQDAWARADDAKISAQTDGELPRLWDEIWAIPPADRRKVDPEAFALRLYDAEAAIEVELQGERYVKGPARTAAGIREPIFRAIAQDVSLHWGKEINPHMVRHCFNEYRAMNKAMTNAQLACDGIATLLRWLGVPSSEV